MNKFYTNKWIIIIIIILICIVLLYYYNNYNINNNINNLYDFKCNYINNKKKICISKKIDNIEEINFLKKKLNKKLNNRINKIEYSNKFPISIEIN